VSESKFRDVNAQQVQFADTINNHPPAPSADQVAASGYILLGKGLYADALRRFGDAVTADPSHQDAHFGMAVALLGGYRPHRHSEETIRRVGAHLGAAADLTEARLLKLLVAEDRGLHWQRRARRIPSHVKALAEQASPERAELVLRHVPAEESRTWRAIHDARRSRS
jgi:hypothetical protein